MEMLNQCLMYVTQKRKGPKFWIHENKTEQTHMDRVEKKGCECTNSVTEQSSYSNKLVKQCNTSTTVEMLNLTQNPHKPRKKVLN